MMKEQLNLISLQEAIDLLGISRATIDRWRKEKRLPHIKIGKEVWIDRGELEQWIKRHAVSGPQGNSGRERGAWTAAKRAGRAELQVVTIGYQSGAALLWSPLIIKQLGLFEEELARLNPYVKPVIQWVNAPNGMELVEKLVTGEVHIASVGDYPIMASRTLSQYLPRFRPQVLAFDGKTGSGDGISLVIPAASGIRHPEQLASAAVAIVGNSSSSYRLKEWTTALGLRTEPVIHRGMGDCLAGIMKGKVEAGVLWEPYLSWVKTLGAGLPLLSEGVGSDYLTGLMADGNWVGNNETIVIAYLKAHLRAHEFIRLEPYRAAQLIHQASGFPLDLIAGVLQRIRWDASFYSRDLQTLTAGRSKHADWPPTYKKAADELQFGNQYLQEAAEALRLPVLPDSPLPGAWSSEVLY